MEITSTPVCPSLRAYKPGQAGPQNDITDLNPHAGSGWWTRPSSFKHGLSVHPYRCLLSFVIVPLRWIDGLMVTS